MWKLKRKWQREGERRVDNYISGLLINIWWSSSTGEPPSKDTQIPGAGGRGLGSGVSPPAGSWCLHSAAGFDQGMIYLPPCPTCAGFLPSSPARGDYLPSSQWSLLQSRAVTLHSQPLCVSPATEAERAVRERHRERAVLERDRGRERERAVLQRQREREWTWQLYWPLILL